MTDRRVVFHELAEHDLEARSEFIRQDNPPAALRFLECALLTIQRLALAPFLGARFEPEHPQLDQLRFLPIEHFKHDLVFYQPMDDGIVVLRVLHGARDISSLLAEDFGLEEGSGEDETNAIE